MMLGTILALFYQPDLFAWSSLAPFALAVAATCLVASSNYVLNEILDGPTRQPAPEEAQPAGAVRPRQPARSPTRSGSCSASPASALALTLNPYFAASVGTLWVMGVTYNVPPLRTKEWPYLDVLSESVNNAVRLLLGWFALVTTAIPPVSLVLSYWMLGAFFMATKRFAEYRHIGDAGASPAATAARSATTPKSGCSSACSSTPPPAPCSLACSSSATTSS